MVSNMTSFKRFESKPVVKIILIYDRLNLWRAFFLSCFYAVINLIIVNFYKPWFNMKILMLFHDFDVIDLLFHDFIYDVKIMVSNMTSFKRFESKPVVKIILIYDRLNLWRHQQFITIFYQFLTIYTYGFQTS
jgi:hypothetical protein